MALVHGGATMAFVTYRVQAHAAATTTANVLRNIGFMETVRLNQYALSNIEESK